MFSKKIMRTFLTTSIMLTTAFGVVNGVDPDSGVPPTSSSVDIRSGSLADLGFIEDPVSVEDPHSGEDSRSDEDSPLIGDYPSGEDSQSSEQPQLGEDPQSSVHPKSSEDPQSKEDTEASKDPESILLDPDSPKSANKKKGYVPTWESLESRPLPEWYDRAKFGIFIHWGVYSVPALGDWFWYNWKIAGSNRAEDYVKSNYKPGFAYPDFANDFNARWFNPQEWARMFAASGAKYVVLTSKHHDGFTLWPSTYTFGWNSVDMGPHRDLVGELANAVREEGMKYGLYYSLYEWFNRLYISDRDTKFTSQRYVDQKTIPELKEIVDKYHPEVIWCDGEWETQDDYWRAKDFLTWLYSSSAVKETVVVNDRWGSNTLCKHGGFLTCADRYKPGKLVTRKWENALTIDKRAWGYRVNANVQDYYSMEELITSLVQTVSWGGNMLLNVGPTADGKIIPIMEERLLGIGKWLGINGAAIYDTVPWPVCQNDEATSSVWYTANRDDQSVIYAIILDWPSTGDLLLKCIPYLSSSAVVTMFGVEGPLKWVNALEGIEVTMPTRLKVSVEWAWALQITGVEMPIISDAVPNDLTTSEAKPSNETTSYAEPSNSTTADVTKSNLTTSDAEPHNWTTCDDKPNNLATSDGKPSDSITADAT